MFVVLMNDVWFYRMVQLATHLMPQSIYCIKRLVAIELVEMVMSIGRQEVEL